jgi:thioredoxin-dependent peroxiredoxin
MKKLHSGDFAPNFLYESPFDKTSREYFAECQNKKSVLFFLRYVGCLVCQLDIKQINDNLASFRDKDTEVFVIIQSSIESIESYHKVQNFDFKIVSDPSSKIYASYAVQNGNLLQFLNPKSIPRVIKSLRYGFKHGKFEGKETQLPAVFIVDKSHKITFEYYGSYMSDLPTIQEILEKI